MKFEIPQPGLGLETKYTALSSLTETGEIGRINGYASRFGEPDQSGDVVVAGAFAKSLARLKEAGRSVKFLWQHDPTKPIGVWKQVKENATGLWVSGEVLTDIQLGKEAALLMKAGAIDGLSIGYKVIKSQKNAETGGRNLIEIDLWEVSLVTFPMLPSARAHSDAALETSDDIAAALAEALAN
ncbi:MAG: HK97 family phage prohead protease [Pseudomonadota bacterium]